MENTGVSFKKMTIGGSTPLNYFTITIDGDSADYLSLLQSLLTLMGRIPADDISQGERYDICHLIESMLPSMAQMQQIEDLQKKGKTV